MAFVKGDRIALVQGKLRYGAYGDGAPTYGVITDELADGRVMIKWDSEWKNKNNNTPVDRRQLAHEAEISEKYSALEEEFKNIEAEVKVKLKEAGDLIVSAKVFAAAAGFDLQELRGATRTLENSMEKAGWNTSSWHC